MSDEALELEKLAAEVLGNWSYGNYAATPTTQHGQLCSKLHGGACNCWATPSAGSQSHPTVSHPNNHSNTPNSGLGLPAAEEWIQLPFDGWDAVEYGAKVDKPAAKTPGGSTQRVIPDRCSYHGGQRIWRAPMVPMSALTAEAHPDMAAAAQKKIRGWVCSRMRAWPVCGPSQRNVSIDFRFAYDAELGDVMVGFWKCGECK